MLTGTHSGYWVIQWSYDWDPSLADLLAEEPALVLDKYIAIASCDSGPYKPTSDEMARGWDLRGNTAISPKITELNALPMPGFDEWYVYEEKPASYNFEPFVNTFGFSPLTSNEEEVTKFWAQVEAAHPLHVIGAGTPTMFLVTRIEEMFEAAKRFNLSLNPDDHSGRPLA